jgi:ribosomal protein S18 acetylase RimI-like enzyme
MQLRAIEEKDRSSLAAMLRRIPQFKPGEVAVAEELIEGSIVDPQGSGYESIVAVEDDSVLGYINFGPTPMTRGTWDLYWIAVAPEAQGRGLGHALYGAFVEAIVPRGGAQIRIETSSQESYSGTGAFYERLGFSIDGCLRNFYAPGDDLLIFYRVLA